MTTFTPVNTTTQDLINLVSHGHISFNFLLDTKYKYEKAMRHGPLTIPSQRFYAELLNAIQQLEAGK